MQGAGAGQKWVIVTEREPALFRLALRASMRYDGPCGGRIVPRLTCAGGGSTQSLTEGVPSMEPKHYAAVVPLSDVGTIQVRAIRPDDRERILDLFHRLTRRTIYFRFHEPKTELSQDELTRYTDLDFEERVALVAVIGSGDAEKIVGVGRIGSLSNRGPDEQLENLTTKKQPRQHSTQSLTLVDMKSENAQAKTFGASFIVGPRHSVTSGQKYKGGTNGV